MELTLTLDAEHMRRLVSIARLNLFKLQREEGSQFPKSDRDLRDLLDKFAFTNKL